jgi:hypothetical protein
MATTTASRQEGRHVSIADGADVVRAYQQATIHGGDHDRSRLVSFRPLDPTNWPEPFKRYLGLEIDPLGPDDDLGGLLFLAAGVTRTTSGVGQTSYFRTAMSAGNLHPVEVYVVGNDLSVRHYHPLLHGLTTLRPGGGDRPAALVLTGIPWRTCWKYGERGWRHLYWDAGTMAANVLAVAPGASASLDFDDAGLSRLLGLDGVGEFPLAVVTLADGDLPIVPADVPALDVDAAPVAPRPIEFPLVTEIQRATVEARGRLPGHRPARGPNLGGEAIDELILRRGSTRLFRHETVAEDAFRRPMEVAADGIPLLEHHVAVHAVEGHEPYPREATQHLCYDQPLGGDSAYTAFHCAELDRVLSEFGPRGYRAALFESGLAAGRLQLAAFSMGLGASGLTFLDDDVQAAFQTSASCMLVTAVGVPDYRSRRGGGPGHPTELTGFEHLMSRLQLRMMRGGVRLR